MSVIKYILKENKGLDVPKYFLFGTIYQLFKRVIRRTISHRIFNGKEIYLYPDCTVSSMFAYTSIPDKEEIEILREMIKLKKNTVFLDIGANIGSYSVCVMDICDGIIAFEPHPFTSKRCKMNFLLNDMSENCVKQLALSNQIGYINFSDNGSSSTTNKIIKEGGIEVEMTTLDKFFESSSYSQKNFVIKMDVEGFEKEVLEGGKNFFQNSNIEGIIFECFSQAEVFEILNSYGFNDIKQLSQNNFIAKKR